jgi:hypothetical protein
MAGCATSASPTVAPAEHGHRPHRNLLHAQIRTRQRLALRQRRIERSRQPLARAYFAREQLQLTRGTSALAFETRFRQPGLGVRALDQRVAERGDAVRDPF